MAFPPPAPSLDPKKYLEGLAHRIEFRQLSRPPPSQFKLGKELAEKLSILGVRAYFAPPSVVGDLSSDSQGSTFSWSEVPKLEGLQLHPLQMFCDNFMVPDAPNPRLLLCWDTGTGKTIAAITIAQRFVNLFRSYKLVAPEERPSVFIIGFTRSVIQAEMLREPRHGLITYGELEELRRLQVLARKSPAGSPEVRQYYGYLGTLKRSLTDRTRGGYYKFFGYKEFATQLFVITAKGEKKGLKVIDLFLRKDDQGSGEVDGETLSEEKSQMERFVARISKLESEGMVRINSDLMEQLRGGLIISDEIHNVYNVNNPNMYGVALQFVLDAFPAKESPRAILMTATPMSGSPSEVVDLLNLLVPRSVLPGKKPLKKKDFFEKSRSAATPNSGGSRPVYSLRPGAAAAIEKLSAGRVSFLTVDMDRPPPESGVEEKDPLFPKREYLGTSALEATGGTSRREIPFLKFEVCPLAPKHLEALKAWQGNGPTLRLPSPTEYSLFDMVFPNPEGGLGLYSSPASNPIYNQLAISSPEWRAKEQVTLITGSSAAGRNVPVISGGFLERKNLKQYSGKYQQYVENMINFIKKGPGKILTYHDRVQLTGVSLLCEILKQNGFVDLGEPAGPSTLCTHCGMPLRDHKEKKNKSQDRASAGCSLDKFVPARFAPVTGAMDSSAQEKTIALFNRESNVDGHELRILIGSMVIIEGLDFKAIVAQEILSIPQDVSTLVQILGRGSRRGAHALLPPERRKIATRIYLNGPVDSATNAASFPPDQIKITRKMREYMLILECLSALRRAGINGFLAQSQILAKQKASLVGLPFEPLVPHSQIGKEAFDHSYFAYGASENNLRILKDGIRALFRRRPVWEAEELKKALATAGVLENISVDPSQIPEEVIDLALYSLASGSKEEAIKAVSHITGRQLISADLFVETERGGEFRKGVRLNSKEGKSYILAVPVTSSGRRVVDIESYIRQPDRATQATLQVNLRKFVSAHLKNINFDRRLADFVKKHEDTPMKNFRRVLVEYDSDFHYALVEHILKMVQAGRGKVTLPPALDKMHRLYSRFRVYVTLPQLKAASGFESVYARLAGSGSRSADPSRPVGYIHEDSAKILTALPAGSTSSPEWTSIPLSAVGRGKFRQENSITVGYMEVKGTALRFKLREPIHELEKQKVRDIRSLARGAVCETRPRSDQLALAKRLPCAGGKLTGAQLKDKSTPELCRYIQDCLLSEEESSRARSQSGVRWFYLFNERLPSIRMPQ